MNCEVCNQSKDDLYRTDPVVECMDCHDADEAYWYGLYRNSTARYAPLATEAYDRGDYKAEHAEGWV
jgi:hypothetical protein